MHFGVISQVDGELELGVADCKLFMNSISWCKNNDIRTHLVSHCSNLSLSRPRLVCRHIIHKLRLCHRFSITIHIDYIVVCSVCILDCIVSFHLVTQLLNLFGRRGNIATSQASQECLIEAVAVRLCFDKSERGRLVGLWLGLWWFRRRDVIFFDLFTCFVDSLAQLWFGHFLFILNTDASGDSFQNVPIERRTNSARNLILLPALISTDKAADHDWRTRFDCEAVGPIIHLE